MSVFCSTGGAGGVVGTAVPASRHRSVANSPVSRSGGALFRHDVMSGVLPGAETSRSRSGFAASSNQSRICSSSRAVRVPSAPRSRSVSSTAQASAYMASWRPSSSSRAMTSSFSLSSSSRARWRDTQSHCRHRWLQNTFGRPGPVRAGSTRRHHRHRDPTGPPSSRSQSRPTACFVMTVLSPSPLTQVKPPSPDSLTQSSERLRP